MVYATEHTMQTLDHDRTAYRGRFAPSPTGPLHFGSLVAALGSCLEARVRGGEWLLRIEDVDLPRCQPGADTLILRALEAFGFAWDGMVIYQSRCVDRYQAALETLRPAGLVFPCACTRKELADSAIATDGAQIYPGTCRAGLPMGKAARAWRLSVPDEHMTFQDKVMGCVEQNLARDVGDFVLLRADGLFAYQLAVVVDDAAQGITHVVRGADLIESTIRQIHLQRCLGYSIPEYAHLPVALNAAGEKLAKQTLAAPVDLDHCASALVAALRFLGQTPPVDLEGSGIANIWTWAIANWNLSRVPCRRGQTAPDYSR